MNILIAGDYCEKNRVADFVSFGKYELLFDEGIRSTIKKADYAIVNFEFPIVVGHHSPIAKCGPNLKGSSQSIEAIKYAGFKCATLANNHILDYGPEALLETKRLLEDKGVDTVGIGKNLKESGDVFYKKINGEIIAIINCCEHEFSIASESTPGANPLNPVRQFYSIQEARSHADYVLIIVHGGHELWQLPSLRMVETYRFFIDCGADAVVNHHQHCFSGYEEYKGKPIFYGLGNFCFDNPAHRKSIWNEGYMVNISFEDGINYEIIPYRQCEAEPQVVLVTHDAFSEKLIELNDTITNKEKLSAAMDEYYNSCAKYYSNIFEPVDNKYYYACKSRGWLPSLVSVKRKLCAQDYICCEAHRDKLIHWLNKTHR